MSISVLAFGHIPKFRGGQQQSGLANAMWAIAAHMHNSEQDVDLVFCATDIYATSITIDDVPVIGWTKMSLIRAILFGPLQSLRLVSRLMRLCRKYQQPALRTSLRALLLQDAINRTAPNYLHLHGCESVVLLQAGIFDCRKTLVTIHGMFGKEGPEPLARLEAALNRLPVKVLAFVSNDIASEWQATFGASEGKIEVIPNAYDSREFYRNKGAPLAKGGDKGTYRLVSVGSVCDRKGQLRVVDAMARFSKTVTDFSVEYTMVGGSLPDTFVDDVLRRAAEANILAHHIPYLAPGGLRALLWQADYMILPTSNEGFGLVFLESIACGTPVVLPKDLPICKEPEIISSANSVLLESSSADAVLAFLQDLPNHRFADADVAISIPEFTWSAVGQRYRNLLLSDQ